MTREKLIASTRDLATDALEMIPSRDLAVRMEGRTLGARISDVFVDDRSIIYAADRACGGLYVLEYIGKRPLN